MGSAHSARPRMCQNPEKGSHFSPLHRRVQVFEPAQCGKLEPSDAQGRGAPKTRPRLSARAENSNPLTSRVAVHPKFEPFWCLAWKTRTL